jgi:LmbE family N-acetylglucosaminyl deacetylase
MGRGQSESAAASSRDPAGFDPAEPGTDEACWAPLLAALEPPDWERGDAGTVVVVAPHPDDETLGAGGMVHDLSARGWRAVVLAVTDGEAAYGRDPVRVARLRRVRPLEQARALFRLSPRAESQRLGLPDGRVASHKPELSAVLRSLAREASLLISTWRGDGHPDHRATAEVTADVAAAVRVPFAEFPIWAWHWSSPDQMPRARLRGWRLSPAALEAKRLALRAFPSQISASEGPPVLGPHVIARFLRPIEAFFV